MAQWSQKCSSAETLIDSSAAKIVCRSQLSGATQAKELCTRHSSISAIQDFTSGWPMRYHLTKLYQVGEELQPPIVGAIQHTEALLHETIRYLQRSNFGRARAVSEADNSRTKDVICSVRRIAVMGPSCTMRWVQRSAVLLSTLTHARISHPCKSAIRILAYSFKRQEVNSVRQSVSPSMNLENRLSIV